MGKGRIMKRTKTTSIEISPEELKEILKNYYKSIFALDVDSVRFIIGNKKDDPSYELGGRPTPILESVMIIAEEVDIDIKGV